MERFIVSTYKGTALLSESLYRSLKSAQEYAVSRSAHEHHVSVEVAYTADGFDVIETYRNGQHEFTDRLPATSKFPCQSVTTEERMSTSYIKNKLSELRERYPMLSDHIIKDILLAGIEVNAVWEDGRLVVGTMKKKFTEIQKEVEAA